MLAVFLKLPTASPFQYDILSFLFLHFLICKHCPHKVIIDSVTKNCRWGRRMRKLKLMVLIISLKWWGAWGRLMLTTTPLGGTQDENTTFQMRFLPKCFKLIWFYECDWNLVLYDFCNNFSNTWDNCLNLGTSLHCLAPFRLWSLLKPLWITR